MPGWPSAGGASWPLHIGLGTTLTRPGETSRPWNTLAGRARALATLASPRGRHADSAGKGCPCRAPPPVPAPSHKWRGRGRCKGRRLDTAEFTGSCRVVEEMSLFLRKNKGIPLVERRWLPTWRSAGRAPSGCHDGRSRLWAPTVAGAGDAWSPAARAGIARPGCPQGASNHPKARCWSCLSDDTWGMRHGMASGDDVLDRARRRPHLAGSTLRHDHHGPHDLDLRLIRLAYEVAAGESAAPSAAGRSVDGCA